MFVTVCLTGGSSAVEGGRKGHAAGDAGTEGTREAGREEGQHHAGHSKGSFLLIIDTAGAVGEIVYNYSIVQYKGCMWVRFLYMYVDNIRHT